MIWNWSAALDRFFDATSASVEQPNKVDAASAQMAVFVCFMVLPLLWLVVAPGQHPVEQLDFASGALEHLVVPVLECPMVAEPAGE